MRVSEEFSGNYFSAADVPHPIVFIVSGDTKESMPDTKVKTVLWFSGETRGLVLNKTNANSIAELYGDDSGHWVGHPMGHPVGASIEP